MSKQNKHIKSEAKSIDIDKLKKNMVSFDKAMNETRRDFILKSTSSKKSASELVLSS